MIHSGERTAEQLLRDLIRLERLQMRKMTALRLLVNKRSFAVKERSEKKRKVEDQATTSRAKTKASQGESKTEDDVL